MIHLSRTDDIVWLSIPPDVLRDDRCFIVSIPGSAWNARAKMYAIDARYLSRLIANMVMSPDVKALMPFSSKDEELQEEIDLLVSLYTRADAFRTGSTIENTVPAWLEYGGFSPRLYQYHGAQYMRLMKRCLLALAVGTGKTLTAITAAKLVARDLYAHDQDPHGPLMLVICPSSIKTLVWAREIAKFSRLMPLVIEGNEAHRHNLYHACTMSDGPDVVIINPELVTRDVDAMHELAQCVSIIAIDEATILKNEKTRISQVVAEMSEHVEYLWEMSGTPMMNSIMEMHDMMSLLDPALFRDRRNFQYTFMPRVNGEWVKHGVQNEKALVGLVDPMMYTRTPAELKAMMPDSTTALEPVDLTTAQRKVYEEIRKQATVVLEDYRDMAPGKRVLVIRDVMTAIVRMKQCCNGMMTRDNANPKLKRVLELLDADLLNDKVILFSQFTETIDMLAEALRKAGHGVVCLTGSMSQQKRVEAVDAFQGTPQTRILIMSTAGGMGLNLQMASAVIMYDMLWNPKMMDQIVARAIRLGNTAQSVAILILLATDTIEEKILARNIAKADTYDAIMGGRPVDHDAVVSTYLELKDLLA